MKNLTNLSEMYVAPSIDVCEVAVEEGFGVSGRFEQVGWDVIEQEEEF